MTIFSKEAFDHEAAEADETPNGIAHLGWAIGELNSRSGQFDVSGQNIWTNPLYIYIDILMAILCIRYYFFGASIFSVCFSFERALIWSNWISHGQHGTKTEFGFSCDMCDLLISSEVSNPAKTHIVIQPPLICWVLCLHHRLWTQFPSATKWHVANACAPPPSWGESQGRPVPLTSCKSFWRLRSKKNSTALYYESCIICCIHA